MERMKTTRGTFTQYVAEQVRLEAMRREVDTQTEIARLAGISQPTAGRYFWSLEREIPLDVLLAVSKGLGVSLSELIRRAEVAADAAQPGGFRTPDVQRVQSTERLPRIVD